MAADILRQSKSTARRLQPGEDIFSFGAPCDAIHMLLSGWAYVFRPLEDGQQIILRFADRGAIVGFHPEPNAIAQYSARALSNSTVAAVSYEKFKLLFGDTRLALRLAALLSRDRNLAFDSVTLFRRASARQRVAQLLLQVALRSGTSGQALYSRELCIPLTQEHVANATGLSTGHVNRTLGELRKNGVVEFQYRKLRILSFAKLTDAAAATAAPPHESVPVGPLTASGGVKEISQCSSSGNAPQT